MDTEKQGKNRLDYLKPWQFQPGKSGNPGGKKKGTVSLKAYAKKMLEELDEEGKMKFMKGLDKDTIWKMAEGMPQTNTDITSGGKAFNIEINSTIAKKNVPNTITGDDSSGSPQVQSN